MSTCSNSPLTTFFKGNKMQSVIADARAKQGEQAKQAESSRRDRIRSLVTSLADEKFTGNLLHECEALELSVDEVETLVGTEQRRRNLQAVASAKEERRQQCKAIGEQQLQLENEWKESQAAYRKRKGLLESQRRNADHLFQESGKAESELLRLNRA